MTLLRCGFKMSRVMDDTRDFCNRDGRDIETVWNLDLLEDSLPIVDPYRRIHAAWKETGRLRL